MTGSAEPTGSNESPATRNEDDATRHPSSFLNGTGIPNEELFAFIAETWSSKLSERQAPEDSTATRPTPPSA